MTMKKLTPNLNEILRHDLKISERIWGADPGEVHVSLTNIDDIFWSLNIHGYKEVEVDRNQMIIITLYMTSQVTGKLPYDLTTSEKWEALAEGKVDKFLGVSLILKE